MNGVYARGAEELLIALQTPSPRGHQGVPVLLWGKPGGGKTSFVESLGRDGFPVTTLIASIHDPTDFSGLPMHIDGRTAFAPPEWVYQFDDQEGGILFLDELTTAPPSVQSALLRVVLERRVGVRSLPPEVRIVAAANPPDTIVGGWELSPPLANRFVHLDWELSPGEFCNALRDGFGRASLPVIDPQLHREQVGHWKMLIEAFLRIAPHLVYTEAGDEEYAFATPRSWEYAIHLMASCDQLGKAYRVGKGDEDGEEKADFTVFLRLLQGCVGRGAVQSLMVFLRGMRIPDPEKYLAGELVVHVGDLADDELYVFFSSLAAVLSRQGKTEQILPSTMQYLELVAQVNRAERVDAVFAPLRQVARGQVMQQAMAVAHRQGELVTLQRQIERVFQGTPLTQYISLLGNVTHDGEE